MRAKKSYSHVYSLLPRNSDLNKSTNVVDLIKKNKEEEKKEKIIKIYTFLGCLGLFFFMGIYIYL